MAFPDPCLRAGQRLKACVRMGALALTLAASGCVSTATPARTVIAPRPSAPAPPPAPRSVQPSKPLQCVPYARTRSGIDIYGDARTWYDQAARRYERSSTPQIGAVIVLGGTPGGHVAVVSAILSAREILVDHANWANDGAIHLGAPVRDVSEQGDWSAVRVWHLASGQLGARIYPVRGFILPSTQLGALTAPPFGEGAG